MPGITSTKLQNTLPSTRQLLTMGGDRRIACDTITKTNKYHCQPVPDSSLLAYGSATASTISAAAYDAAECLRQHLENCARMEPAPITYTREMERIRNELQSITGLKNTDILFAASGTDLHLLAAQLTAGTASTPPLILMMESSETGSGVPTALAGRHFSDTTVSGDTVTSGTPVSGAALMEIITIASRGTDGNPLPATMVDQEFAAAAERAIADGRHVLLIVTDVSKTGLIVPSLSCVLDLHQRFPAQLDIMVDACQFRIAPATLKAYLDQDFMVAATGSKFVSGPAFSAALFTPPARSQSLSKHILPKTLGQYSVQGDWPQGWDTQKSFPDVANFGLLLRWQAALTELHAFHVLPEADVTRFLQRFADTVQARLDNDSAFEALATPAPDRKPLASASGWDNIPTLFCFLLKHKDGTYLTRSEMEGIYKRLRHDHQIELGQPVLCGTRASMPVSALRLCVSARLITDAMAGRGSDQVINDALYVLDKTAALISA